MEIKVLGIDRGKTVCSLAGLDEAGAVVFRKRLQRHRLLDFLDKLPPCIVAMEACSGANHIWRFCLQNRHEPRLMSPLYVRPYVKVHKNDDRGAEAIAEAATHPTMSFVAIKSEEQFDLQALHRARERLVSDRTRLINQGCGFLMEPGIRVGTRRHVFQKELTRSAAEGADDLSPRMLMLLSDMASELDVTNDRVADIDAETKALAKTDADMQRLMEIPGVGPTIATALVAAVGTGSSFREGSDLAAWFGLVPRQVTTGGKAISKHGNRYLRKLFIHGARTVQQLVRDRTTPITACADGLKERAHVNVTAVAMANKMAGIAWAVLTKGKRYRPNALSGL